MAFRMYYKLHTVRHHVVYELQFSPPSVFLPSTVSSQTVVSSLLAPSMTGPQILPNRVSPSLLYNPQR